MLALYGNLFMFTLATTKCAELFHALINFGQPVRQ